jgi:hypothetical protein
MKIFAYFVLTLSTLCALFIFAAVICWGVSLPNTALLWIHGFVNGWAFLIIFATVCALFALLPALCINEELKNNKY